MPSKLDVMKYSELHGLVMEAIALYKDSRHPLRRYARAIINDVVSLDSIDPSADKDFDLPPKLALRGHKLNAMMEIDRRK